MTPVYSVELFPPKTAEGMDKLKQEIPKINALGPAYFSVTYGAGGSTREGTFETVAWLRAVFWLLLIGFLAWDFTHSAPVDMRFEPPLLAAGSGQSSVGGHCSMPD